MVGPAASPIRLPPGRLPWIHSPKNLTSGRAVDHTQTGWGNDGYTYPSKRSFFPRLLCRSSRPAPGAEKRSHRKPRELVRWPRGLPVPNGRRGQCGPLRLHTTERMPAFPRADGFPAVPVPPFLTGRGQANPAHPPPRGRGT